MTRWLKLLRARRLAESSDQMQVFFFGICSALSAPALVFILGLIVQVLVDKDQYPVTIGPLQIGWLHIENWPLMNRHEHCLLILIAAGLIVSLFISVTLFAFYRSINRTAIHVGAALRQKIYDQSLRIGANDFLGTRSADRHQLFDQRVNVVEDGVRAWSHAISRSIVALAALVVLSISIDFLMSLLAVLLVVMIWRSYVWLREQSDNERRLWSERARIQQELLSEGLRLTPLTPSSGSEKKSNSAFSENLRNYTLASLRSNLSGTVVIPMLFFVVLVSAACMLVVLGLPSSPRIGVAGTVVLGTALICAFFPMLRLYRLPPILDEAEGAAAEIFRYLDREPAVMQVTGATVLERLQAGIELDQHGSKLLEEITMSVPVGGRIGVMASDGRIPMVLAGLFVRFYDPAFGRVLFDKRDIRNVTLDSLRQQAAMVRHRDSVFTGEVMENIDCGEPRFTMLQITDAAKRAGAYDFIQQLPQGFSTIVGDQGEYLQPGQKFRISLARAILRDPSVMLIEEPPVNGEGTNDGIEETLALVGSGRTMIYFPARLSTLRTLDRIFLFHDSKLAAAGNHLELIKSSELYRHLNYQLFNPFRSAEN